MVAPNFYNTVDQGIYNQGYSFIPQERFRGAFNPNTNIGFGSGITNTAAAAPFILPINQGGGGGGDGPGGGFDTDTDDQSTTADDFGFGLEGNDPSMNMTEEEKEAIDAYNNPATTKGMLGTVAGTMFGFMNPITAMFNLNYQRNKQKEAAEQAAKDAAAKADFDRAMADQKGFYDSLNDGQGASVSDKSRNEAGDGNQPGPSPFAYGGRVPYMMGGLASLADIYD